MMSAGAATRTQAPQELTRKAGTVDRSGRDGGDASKNVGTSAGPLTTTNLREGWMASPLLGQAFDPEPLDRCPRGVLQVSPIASSHLLAVAGARCDNPRGRCIQEGCEHAWKACLFLFRNARGHVAEDCNCWES